MNAFVQASIADSLRNLTTGLGALGTDTAVAGAFYYRPRLSGTAIRALYDQSWIGKRAVDLPAEAATGAWRSWHGSRAAIEAMEATERRLDLKGNVMQALRYARRDGGAVILMGGPGNPFEPLDPAQVEKGGIRWLRALPRYRVSCGRMNFDPASPWYGLPYEYRFAGGAGAADLAVHPSRVVTFVGPGAEPFETGEPWGQSVLEAMHDAIRGLEATLQACEAVVQELKVDVIRIPGLTMGAVNPEYRQQVIARFSLAQSLKSIRHALVLDAQEEWSQKTASFSQLPQLIDRLMIVVSGATAIPSTLLFGRSPAGENATGQGDLENFYKGVAQYQTNVIDSVLESLNECLIRSALGRRPRNLFCTWNSLWSLSETDLSKIRREHAAAAKDLADAGLVNRAALGQAAISQSETDGWLPGLAQLATEPALAAETEANSGRATR